MITIRDAVEDGGWGPIGLLPVDSRWLNNVNGLEEWHARPAARSTGTCGEWGTRGRNGNVYECTSTASRGYGHEEEDAEGGVCWRCGGVYWRQG